MFPSLESFHCPFIVQTIRKSNVDCVDCRIIEERLIIGMHEGNSMRLSIGLSLLFVSSSNRSYNDLGVSFSWDDNSERTEIKQSAG